MQIKIHIKSEMLEGKGIASNIWIYKAMSNSGLRMRHETDSSTSDRARYAHALLNELW
jgi:hypothetical protein